MMPAALAACSDSPHDLTIVPMPHDQLTQSLRAPNVVRWSQHVEVEEIAGQAVKSLVSSLDTDSSNLKSTVLQMSCKLVSGPRPARMELTTRWETGDEFAIERSGAGQGWRHLENEHPGDAPADLEGATTRHG